MQNYYVSFGWGTQHDIGYIILNKDVLLKIKEHNYEKARKYVVSMFGNKWSNIYTQEGYSSVCGYYNKIFVLNGYELLYIDC